MGNQTAGYDTWPGGHVLDEFAWLIYGINRCRFCDEYSWTEKTCEPDRDNYSPEIVYEWVRRLEQHIFTPGQEEIKLRSMQILLGIEVSTKRDLEQQGCWKNPGI